MNEEREIISSHIFVFPFRWDYISNGEGLDGSIDKRLNVDKVIKILNDTGCWDEDKPDIENEDDEYNKYIYFYDNVREAIYGKNEYRNKKKDIKNRIVRRFKYKKINDNSMYSIKICKREEAYLLSIKAIKLKIYDTGVAALSFFLENYDQDSTSEDILNINDYGRRIFPQFLPFKEVQKSFLAEKISLELAHKKIEENFNYEIKKNPNRISNTIMELLGKKFKYDIKKIEKGQVFIEPIIDDRMFTLCIYRNDAISSILTYRWKNKYKNSQFWYKYVFIDNYNLTCQDKEMFKKLIEKSTYTRWKNYGTLYGISRYSLVVIVNEEDFGLDVLFKHFNNMYYEMSLLALIERALILRISDEASKIAALDEYEALQNVKKLQKCYVEFINDLYFREVTAQEQGIEMFNKLVEMMEVERDVKRLGDEIEGIQKYTSMVSNELTSNLLKIITYLGIGFTVCNFAINLFGRKVVPIKQWTITLRNNDFNLWMIQRIIIPIGILTFILYLFKCVIKKEKLSILKKALYIILFLAFIYILHISI